MTETAYTALASHYDKLSTHDVIRWQRFICNRLQAQGITPGNRVLDMACGTGALTLALLRAGYGVSGMDLSAEMLSVAKRRARQGNAGIPFTQADMRDFTARVPYSAVLASCDAVNYLLKEEDVLAFFQCARKALKPGGLLLFDVSTAQKLRDMDEETYTEEWDDGMYVWVNTFDRQAAQLKMDLTFFLKEENGLYRRQKESHRQRAWETEELAGLLAEAGYTYKLYGELSERSPDAKAQRIHFAAIPENR